MFLRCTAPHTSYPHTSCIGDKCWSQTLHLFYEWANVSLVHYLRHCSVDERSLCHRLHGGGGCRVPRFERWFVQRLGKLPVPPCKSCVYISCFFAVLLTTKWKTDCGSFVTDDIVHESLYHTQNINGCLFLHFGHGFSLSVLGLDARNLATSISMTE